MARKEVKTNSGGKKLTLSAPRKSRNKARAKARSKKVLQKTNVDNRLSDTGPKKDYASSIWNKDLVDMLEAPIIQSKCVSFEENSSFPSEKANNHNTIEKEFSNDPVLENISPNGSDAEHDAQYENSFSISKKKSSIDHTISGRSNLVLNTIISEESETFVSFTPGETTSQTDNATKVVNNKPMVNDLTEKSSSTDKSASSNKNSSSDNDEISSCDENPTFDTNSSSEYSTDESNSNTFNKKKESRIRPFVNGFNCAFGTALFFLYTCLYIFLNLYTFASPYHRFMAGYSFFYNMFMTLYNRFFHFKSNDTDARGQRRQRRQFRILQNKLAKRRAKNKSRITSCRRKLPEEDMNKLSKKIDSQIKGKRIVDPNYYWEELKKFLYLHTSNKTKKSKIEHIHLHRQSEYHGGLRAMLHFKCSKCEEVYKIWTTPTRENEMELNDAAVLGTVFEGVGFTHAEGIFSAMDVPFMTSKTFRAHQNNLYENVKELSEDSMRKAAEEEAKLAREVGDVDKKSGIPFISVIVNGSWIKRTYKNKYDSLLGVGAIIGLRTGKVLFVGIKNKFCYKCHMAAKSGKKVEHNNCVKNFNRNSPSTLMESEALLEGFMESIETHNLIYRYFIGDGDSSFCNKLFNVNPYARYNIQTQKIECINHLMRNFTSKIITIGSRRQKRGVPYRQGFVPCRDLVKNKALTIRNTILEEIDRQIADTNKSWDAKIADLRRRLLNVPSHVFGEHRYCKTYGRDCFSDEELNNNKVEKKNYVPYLKSFGFYDDIVDEFKLLCNHCDSLLHKMSNNKVESFNNIICKQVSGKRINYTASNQYDMRVRIAVIQHNTQEAITEIYKAMGMYVPEVLSDIVKARKKKVADTREARAVNGRQRKYNHSAEENKHYGENCEKPDQPPEIIEKLLQEHYEQMEENRKNRVSIEEETRDQSSSDYWLTIRKKMLTASNFASICKNKCTKSWVNKVKEILHSRSKRTSAMEFGIRNEPISRREFSDIIGRPIYQCGLFIDKKHPMLGASPDGVIDEKTIAEFKNPPRGEDMTAAEAMDRFPDLNFIDKKTKGIKKEHKWHYQIQGQMHITGVQSCYLVLRTNIDLFYILVERDDTFWNEKMEPKLLQFYNDWMFPEIIDSRHKRSMPIRQPSYVTESEKDEKKIAIEKVSRKRKIDITDDINAESDCGIVDNVQTELHTRAKKSRKMTQAPVKKASTVPDNQSTLKGKNSSTSILSIFMKNQTNTNIDLQNTCQNVYSSDDEDCLFVSESYDPKDWDSEMIDTVSEFMERSYIAHEPLKKYIVSSKKLVDDCIDAFLIIVQNNSDYEVQSALYIKFVICVKPAETNRSAIILGGDSTGHWRLAVYDGSKLRVYDSLPCGPDSKLHSSEWNYVQKRFPNIQEKDVIFIAIKTVQPDYRCCGVYALPLLTYLILNGDPSQVVLSKDAMHMRRHFYNILETGELANFPIEDSQNI